MVDTEQSFTVVSLTKLIGMFLNCWRSDDSCKIEVAIETFLGMTSIAGSNCKCHIFTGRLPSL